MLDIFKKILGEDYLYGLLSKACYKNDYHSAKKLIEAGVNVNEVSTDFCGPWDRNTPLGLAVSNNNLELTTLLLENGAIIDFNYPHVSKTLFNVDKNKKNAVEMYKFLIEKGADIKATGCYDASLLFWAIICDSYEVIKFLLENGADPNHDNEKIISPLITACYDSPRSIELLLKAGADPYKKSYEGNTVFEHLAAEQDENIILAKEIFKRLGYEV